MSPHPGYRAFPRGQSGDYQQLSDSLLQIENEFYSPVRPKRVTRRGETPLAALQEGGIEYIEVRCVDVSPFTRLGIDAEQIRFLDTFLLYCLLEESPPCDDADQAMQANNLEAVVNRGRMPGLVLQTPTGERALDEYATELFDDIRRVAEVLDTVHGNTLYTQSTASQLAKVRDPELTPSARVLREMREQDLPFFRVAMSYSEQWATHFREHPLDSKRQAEFEAAGQKSLTDQRAIEQSDEISFEKYLDNYFAQYRAL